MKILILMILDEGYLTETLFKTNRRDFFIKKGMIMVTGTDFS